MLNRPFWRFGPFARYLSFQSRGAFWEYCFLALLVHPIHCGKRLSFRYFSNLMSQAPFSHHLHSSVKNQVLGIRLIFVASLALLIRSPILMIDYDDRDDKPNDNAHVR
jgi:hypothetical protein